MNAHRSPSKLPAKAALLLLLTTCTGGCSPGVLSTDELLQALQARGHVVTSGEDSKSQVAKEFDNLNDAFASNMPMPRLTKSMRVDGVPIDFFFCPGKNEQAKLVIAYLLRQRALRGSDQEKKVPAHLDMAAAGITGHLNIPFESHIVSFRSTAKDDDAVVKIAVSLAEIAAR